VSAVIRAPSRNQRATRPASPGHLALGCSCRRRTAHPSASPPVAGGWAAAARQHDERPIDPRPRSLNAGSTSATARPAPIRPSDVPNSARPISSVRRVSRETVSSTENGLRFVATPSVVVAAIVSSSGPGPNERSYGATSSDVASARQWYAHCSPRGTVGVACVRPYGSPSLRTLGGLAGSRSSGR
jgi:hypothetical protein